MVRQYLKHIIPFNWVLGVTLIIVFSVLRFITVMYSIQSGDNKYLSLLFIVMIVLPFVMLTKKGRKAIKIKAPKQLSALVKSLGLGILICTIVFGLGNMLYAETSLNWFRYIGESYTINIAALPANDKMIYFMVFLAIGMTFSPFGEELLYRGLIHGSLVPRFGNNKAAVIDSLAFAFVHLAHFGILYQNNTWTFYALPALLWFLLMGITGLVFNYCRKISDSIWGAVISHMGFNAAMTYFIFYHIF